MRIGSFATRSRAHSTGVVRLAATTTAAAMLIVGVGFPAHGAEARGGDSTSAAVAGQAGTGPVITGITPDVIAPGSPFTIEGSGFASDPEAISVMVNGAQAEIVSASSTAIELRSPTSTGSGVVTVASEGETTESSTDLIVVPPGVLPDQVGVHERLALGAPIEVGFESPRDVAVLTVALGSDELFDLELGDSSSRLDLQVSVHAPNGSLVLGPVLVEGGREPSPIDALDVAVDGTYTVVLDPAGDATGSAVVEGRAFVPRESRSRLRDEGARRAAPQSGIEVGGDPVIIESQAGDAPVELTAELHSGVTYGLLVSSDGTPTRVTVRDGHEAVVAEDHGTEYEWTVVFTAAEDGLHTIVIASEDDGSGSWWLELFSGVGTPWIILPEAPSGWQQASTLDASWFTATTAPIVGYAVVVDQSPDTEPDAPTQDVDTASLTFPEGDSWLHVRAFLSDGTAGTTGHRLVRVDSMGPELGPISSTTHPDPGETYLDQIVDIAWAPATDPASGVAGYSVEASTRPFGEPDAFIDVVGESTTLYLGGDGQWFIRVRAVDAVGNAGSTQVLEVTIDAYGPSAPTVTASHADGEYSPLRTLVAEFAVAEGEDVVRWSSVIDHEARTVPDPAAATEDPRLVTELAPGEWWLHVAAEDNRGRWSPPTHRRVWVQDADLAILQPAGAWLWETEVVKIDCGVDADGMTLVAIDEGGVAHVIDTLTEVDGRCDVTWDPRGEAGGQRVWPDGAYELAVLDDGGDDAAERVPAVVAVSSSTIDRALADYQAGRISAAELVDLFLQLLTDASSAPARYSDADSSGELSTEVLLAALSRVDPAVRDAVLAALEPHEVTSPAGAARAPVERAASPVCVTTEGVFTACTWRVPGFSISYTPDAVGVPDSYVGVPPRVREVADALTFAATAYSGMGFLTPGGTTRVNLVGSAFPAPGYGISLISGAIVMNVSDGVIPYLPVHEFFHQVQYQYMGWSDQASQPYWWMEATAEWGAHRASQQAGYPQDSAEKPATYAKDLRDFLSDEGELARPATAVLSPGGAEYGAFLVAEYLEERFGGDEAVRWVWDRVGDGPAGVRPLDAVADYVESQGSNYDDAIQEFRTWNYVISRDPGDRIGYVDVDAQPRGPWRDRLDVKENGVLVEDGDAFRRVTASGEVGTADPASAGTVAVKASNTAYIEISKPDGVVGWAQFTVSMSGTGNLSSIRATMIPMAVYPATCGQEKSLPPYTEPPVASRLSFDGPSLAGSVLLGADCSSVTLAVTNTDRGTGLQRVDWAVDFEVDGAVVSNGTLDLGVARSGSMIAGGVGLRRSGDAGSDVLTGFGYPSTAWGLSDGPSDGWVDGVSTYPNGNFGVESFRADDTAAVVEGALSVPSGSTRPTTLEYSLNYRPTASPSLYGIDVEVKRVATASRSGDVLVEFSPNISVPGGGQQLTWASASGEVPASVAWLGAQSSSGRPLLGHVGESQASLDVTYGGGATPSLRLNLGALAVGERATFTVYVGVAPGLTAAGGAVDAVGAALYSFAQSEAGTGNVAVFGVSDVRHLSGSPAPGPEPVR